MDPTDAALVSSFLTSIVRAHWDRPRFAKLEKVYRIKYRKYLVDRVGGEASGAFGQLVKGLILAANLPPPVMSPQDIVRLQSPRSRASSFTSTRSDTGVEKGKSELEDKDEAEKSELEGEGQLSNPPSPISAGASLVVGGDSTPLAATFPSTTDPASSNPQRPATPSEGKASHKSSSSLSFRQRSSPLESSFTHKPLSSSGGSGTQIPSPSLSSLRHSRPTAPGRIRRTSGDHGARMGATSPSESVDSHNSATDRSTTPPGSREQTKSPADQYAIDRRSSSSRSASGSSTTGPTTSSPPTEGPDRSSSPPSSAIDTTSHYATPVSPIGEVGATSSSPSSPTMQALAFSNLSPVTPQEYFVPSPEKETGSESLRRQPSTASTTSVTSGGDGRPGTTFFGTGTSGPELFRPDSMVINPYGFPTRPGSTSSVVSVGDQQFQAMLRSTQE